TRELPDTPTGGPNDLRAARDVDHWGDVRRAAVRIPDHARAEDPDGADRRGEQHRQFRGDGDRERCGNSVEPGRSRPDLTAAARSGYVPRLRLAWLETAFGVW